MLQKHAIEQLTAMMTIDALGYTVRPDLSYYYHDHGRLLADPGTLRVRCRVYVSAEYRVIGFVFNRGLDTITTEVNL